jgi:hypothetical protein
VGSPDFTFTCWEDVKARRARVVTMPLDQFAVRPPGLLYSPALFGTRASVSGCLRTIANILSITAIVGEYDGPKNGPGG